MIESNILNTARQLGLLPTEDKCENTADQNPYTSSRLKPCMSVWTKTLSLEPTKDSNEGENVFNECVNSAAELSLMESLLHLL